MNLSPNDSATPLALGEKHGVNGYTHPGAHSGVFPAAKMWKQPRRPLTEERIQRMHAYTMKCQPLETMR